MILSGTVGEDVVNDGGRLYIDAAAHVMGRVIRSEDGETQVDPAASGDCGRLKIRL